MTRALLDTQAFLLWIVDSPQLSRRAHDTIEAGETTVCFSPISALEIAIKVGVGKLALGGDGGQPLTKIIHSAVDRNRFEVLDIGLLHALAVGQLPLHHRDPFDRLLIAQATVEKLPVITSDRAFAAYDIETIW